MWVAAGNLTTFPLETFSYENGFFLQINGLSAVRDDF